MVSQLHDNGKNSRGSTGATQISWQAVVVYQNHEIRAWEASEVILQRS